MHTCFKIKNKILETFILDQRKLENLLLCWLVLIIYSWIVVHFKISRSPCHKLEMLTKVYSSLGKNVIILLLDHISTFSTVFPKAALANSGLHLVTPKGFQIVLFSNILTY